MRSGVLITCALLCLVACGGKDDKTTPLKPQAGAGGAGGSTAGTGSSNAGSSGSASAGSGGTGATDTDGGPMDMTDSGIVKTSPEIKELAAKLATGICGALLDCVGQSKLDDLVGREKCEDRVSLELANGDLAHLQDSIDAGRVAYDDSKVDVCVAGIKALGCNVETDSFPTACEDAVKGKVATGGECIVSDDCVGNTFCDQTACPSHCAALLKAGDACTKDEQCGDQLSCAGGTCTAPALAGDACAGGKAPLCALGLNCWNASETETGICHTNADTLVGDKDDVCEPGSTLCKEGLSCIYDGNLITPGFQCEPMVESGATCHPGLPGQCPRTEYCDSTDLTVAGKCKALPVDGAPCVAAGCAPGYVCGPENNTPVCHTILQNGGDCSTDAACRSRFCNAGTCQPPMVCPG